jgi:hypothetical protein
MFARYQTQLNNYSLHHPGIYQGSLMLLAGCLIFGGIMSGRLVSAPTDAGAQSPLNQLEQTFLGPDKPVTQAVPELSHIQTAAVTLPPYGVVGSDADPKAIGRAMNRIWFNDSEWPALLNLWTRESNWNPRARNRASGACAIPQALPCNGLYDKAASYQIEWGLNYIKRRYGTPSKAWRFWQSHRWY